MYKDTIDLRVAKFRLKSADRFNISPLKCHIGHVLIEAFLEKPLMVHQIDGATDARDTNMSMLLRSMRLADAMRKSGLKPGDSVVIIGPNHLDVAVPFYACHYNGYSMCCIDVNQGIEELQLTYRNCKPKIIFTQNNCLSKNNKALLCEDLEATIVTFDDQSNDLKSFIEKYKGTEVGFQPEVFNTFDTPAWLMLSSGTTGTPKLTAFTYDNLLSGLVEWWIYSPLKINLLLSLASTQWISSLMFFLSTPIKSYTRLQSSAPLTPQVLVHLINKYRPDGTAWTPYLLAQFVRSAKGVCDLSCFKQIMVAGSAVEKPIVDKFREICKAKLFFCYGMTELLVPIFYNQPETTPFGSTGKPMLDKYQIKLVNDAGDTVEEPHKHGVLWVKGDAFFKEYHNNPEETNKVRTNDGWFNTGDIFYRDENDFYYFVERRKVLVRYFSEWISPLSIEEVIKRHPNVVEACVVGIPNPETMELAVAAVQPKPNTQIEAQEIFDLVNDALPDKSRLHGGLFFVDSFPSTPSGKINRSKLIEIAQNTKRILSKT